jgi:hypothetical protein
MSHYEEIHLHHGNLLKFANTEMIEMFLFKILKEIAFGLLDIFIPIYFLTQGMPISIIMVIFTVRSLVHGLTVLSFGKKVLFKLGIKHTFTLTTLLYILSFIDITQGLTLGYIILWVLLIGVADALYASSYHTFLSLKVDNKKAGKEVAIMEIIAVIVNIATPFLGAVFIAIFGFKHMFVVGSIILLISTIPLFFSKEVDISGQIYKKGLSNLRDFRNHKKKIFISTIGNGLQGSGDPLWSSLYIYKLLGGIEILGGITSGVSFVKIFSFYLSGKRIDKGKSMFNTGINGSIFARFFIFGSFNPYIAVMSNTLEGAISPMFSIPYNTIFYKSLRGENTISYVIAHEIVWHTTHVCAMILVTAMTFFIGWYAFLLAGIFIIIGKLLLRSQKVGIVNRIEGE